MIEHRKELRSKVERQQILLQQALVVSEKEGHPAERISALTTQLTVVSDSVGGGWEKMTVGAAEPIVAANCS